MNSGKIASVLLLGDVDYHLFKLAIHFAEQGRCVRFITEKPLEAIPIEIEKPSRAVSDLMLFVYINKYEELIKYLNNLHRTYNVPDVVILRNLHYYCDLDNDKYQATKAAYLTATLLNKLNLVCKSKTRTIVLLVSCLVCDEKVLQRIKVQCDMYFDSSIVCNYSDDRQKIIGRISDMHCEK